MASFENLVWEVFSYFLAQLSVTSRSAFNYCRYEPGGASALAPFLPSVTPLRFRKGRPVFFVSLYTLVIVLRSWPRCDASLVPSRFRAANLVSASDCSSANMVRSG